MTINFNQPPYFDDYDEGKKFHKILFRPGYAVQTRELNQLQTLLQKQVSRFGSAIYKEGAMVVPGALGYKNSFSYVKLTGAMTSLIVSNSIVAETAITTPATIESVIKDCIGKHLVGVKTGVQATIRSYRLATDTDPLTLYVEYSSSNTNDTTIDASDNKGTVNTFDDAEQLSIIDSTVVSSTDYIGYRVRAIDVAATGNGSAVEVSRGVYFIRGNFVLVEPQTLLLDPYTIAPSYRVGFNIKESIVTPELDSSLSDNANGSFNYSAPGAHRHAIELVLSKLPLGSTDDVDFVELLKISNGTIESHVTTTQYSELAKELARRTYDESGDYAVNGFRMNAKDSRSNDRGEWVAGATYFSGDVVTRTLTTTENDVIVTRVVDYVAATSGVSGQLPPVNFGSWNDGGVTWLYEPNPVYNGGNSVAGDNTKMTIAIEPGKAYVRGFEIAKPSTSFVEVDKSRDYSQVEGDLIPTTIGNYVIAKTITGVPDFTTFATANLYRHTITDAQIVGTARIRNIQRTSDSKFKVYIMAVQMNTGYSFSRDVKHIGNGDFDCTLDDANASNLGKGSVTLSGTTVTGVGTSFKTTFRANDYINIQGNFFQVTTTPTSDTTMIVANPGSVTGLTGVAYSLFLTAQRDQDNGTTIFPLGKSYVRSATNQSTGSSRVKTSYVIMQKATITLGVNETSKTVSLSSTAVDQTTGGGSRIDPNTQVSDIIIAKLGSNSFVTPTSITFNASDDSSFTINGLPASPTGATYTVFFPVTKNTPATARFKTKTLQTYQVKDITTNAGVTSRVISVGKPDVYRIRQIMMADTTGDITSASKLIDVTDYFTLDNGQRDTHYDVASIIRKPSYGAPTGSIRIIFDYFDHSTTGDYFCVDSYLNFTLENIPNYSSSNGTSYRLSDCLDFRPRISDDGASFTGTGAKLAMPPRPGTSTSVDYTYYMPRIDKISIDVDGKFIVTKGTSADVPTAPETPTLAMNMAVVSLNPYTYNAQDVYIQKVDNRRYTMRDIGALEKRIDSLEYYTSLSLLEQQASSMQIQDELGLNRFKNGFIVDNFTGYTVSDATSNEFRASIDSDAKQLRPGFSMDNTKLIEKLLPDTRTGYKVSGDLITLPYTETNFISQQYASRPENINPFAVFTFIGRAELNPPSDEWIETARLPDIINDVDGNYSAVIANAQSKGILGNQWGAWEIAWTGTSTSTENTNRVSIRGGGTAIDTITSMTTQLARKGINTSVKATFSKELISDRIVSTSIVPWIRSRHVAFLARGMRLNTIVHPFFDRTDISQYVTPASRVEFKGMNAANPTDIDKFDYETNVGAGNDEKARRFNNNVESAYNKGDVVYLKRRGASTYATASVSICTGVCILQEVQPGGTTRKALLVNTTGSFQPGDIIGGTISGAEVEVVSFTLGEKGGTLMTNFGGDVAGVFDIPSTDTAKFHTGVREFKLIDNVDNNDLISKTRAHGEYRAQGILESSQATYNSVRNGELVRTPTNEVDPNLITTIIGRAETGVQPYEDPLAQTFLVQNKGGAFITSIDIWFASVDPLRPVKMQIRNVVNGYPGKIALPFSTVIMQPYQLRDENQPAGYGLSSDTVVFDNTQYLAPNKPTKFTMKAPVYVQDMTEYCIVLTSDSNNYNVWTSELGGIDITTSVPRLISEQPYAGVLFKSQNASTWTAHQNEDLTFRINVAQFNSSGVADFNNSRLGTRTLDDNPFFTRALSNLVRVFHPNHGFTPGEKVTISGVSNITSTNGINTADLNKTHDILWVDQDSYVVRSAATTANRTGRMGGTGVASTYNVKFDTIHPIFQTQNFSDTSLSFGIQPTTSSSVSGVQDAGIVATDFYPIIANEDNDFYAPHAVFSSDNETLYLNGAKSLTVRATMATDNPYLSPIIDTSRFSIITVNNRIDSQSYSTANYPEEGFDLYTLVQPTTLTALVSFSGNQITTTNADTKATFAAQRPGKYISISGASTAANNGVYRIVSIASDGSSVTTTASFTTATTDTQVAIKIYDNYIDETAKNGSAEAKYVTKRVDLSNASGVSNSISIRFNANVPPSASVDVYFKIGLISSATPFEDVPWTFFATQGITQGSTDVSFDITKLSPFNAAAIKLVMKSTNSSAVPKISDLIVLATA